MNDGEKNGGSVLVTGATGFIGRHLCALLEERGYTVRCAVRAKGSKTPRGCHEAVEVGDLGPGTRWDEALEGVRFVVHLAARAHRFGSAARDEAGFEAVNVGATSSLARAVAESKTVRRLVYVSSVGAVRSSSEQMLTESTPAEPDTVYGRSKHAGEAAVRAGLREAAADWCIVRPPLVYGAGNPGNMERLHRLIATGLPLPLGAISNRRSFVFVGNLVDALERCMWHDGASRSTFFVTDGPPISTPGLVREIASLSSRPARLVPIPLPLLRLAAWGLALAGRLTNGRIDIGPETIDKLSSSLPVDGSLIEAQLDWKPPYSRSEGLLRTYAGEQ